MSPRLGVPITTAGDRARVLRTGQGARNDAPMVVKPSLGRDFRPDLLSAVAGQDREGPLLAEGRLL